MYTLVAKRHGARPAEVSTIYQSFHIFTRWHAFFSICLTAAPAVVRRLSPEAGPEPPAPKAIAAAAGICVGCGAMERHTEVHGVDGILAQDGLLGLQAKPWPGWVSARVLQAGGPVGGTPDPLIH